VPILAGIPVVEAPELPDRSKEDTRTLALRDLDGNYPFAPTGREFFFMPDCDGLDLVDPELITVQVPGMDGSLLKEIRISQRELFLPMWIASDSSHAHYLDQRDSLISLFAYHGRDYRLLGGTFDLVASSIRGDRYLRCTFAGGMKSIKRPNEGQYWAKLGINAVAVQPHWIGERWQTPVIRQPAPVNTFAAFPLNFSTDLALGAGIPISVDGDVDSWITVDLVGPADEVTVTAEGVLFEIPDGLDDGETVKVIMDPRYRNALFDGVQDWSRVGPATTWHPLPPGDQTMNVVVTGAGANTSAQVSGDTLFRRPW
jgi:hypothetical protein